MNNFFRLCIAGSLFCIPAQAQQLAIQTAPSQYKPIAMTVDKLDNGLRVVVVPMTGAPTVAFYTLVQAGSRDEVEVGRSGYAHLFEHLKFRGTEKVPAAEYERHMQSFGSDNNAFTTDDFTFYVPLIPKESLADLVPIEADRFQHLNVPPAPYKDETGAVAGEFNKDFSNPWWAMDEAIREIAFTTDDFTFYVPLIPKESLADLVPIEADRFQHLNVPPAPYKDETGAVAGEFNKDFSNPWWAMDEAIREIAFTQHTYGHTVIGYKRDVDAMPQNHAYSKTFFSRFYVPDDCVIFAVGDVDRATVLDLVKKNYGEWKGTRAQPVIKPEPEQTAPRRRDLTWKGPTTPRMLLGYKSPSAKDHLADSAALSVLVTLVFGEPSELYQRLVVREQKVIELGADPDELLHKDPGLLRIDAKLKEGTSFDEILAAIQGALDAVAQGKVDDKELADARSHLTSSIVLGMQTPGTVAERLAFMTAATGDPQSFDRFMTTAMSVSKDDLVRVAKLLTPAHRDLVTLSPPKAKK